jgi:cupin fold WbuC family metalloprotein
MAFRFPVRKENDEVYYAETPFSVIGPDDLAELKKIASANPRKRARLCVHRKPEALLHEMFIVLGRDAYVRPHSHIGRKEGLMILEGSADLMIFSDSGKVIEVVRMDSHRFYSHLDEPQYHTLRIRSDFLVFYEATTGPFRREDTVFPDWSPDEADSQFIQAFLKEIDSQSNSCQRILPP